MTNMELLDKWREALERAQADEDQDAYPGEAFTRAPFEEVRREFLAWSEGVARLAAAVRDPFAPGAAEVMASYQYDDDFHHGMADVFLDIVDAGEAMQVRADPAQLVAIRAAAKLPRAA